MMTTDVTTTPVRALVQGWLTLAQEFARANDQRGLRRLKVFLDCETWLEDEIKPEDDFVTYVDDRRDADVCMRVAPDTSYGRTRHYQVQFTGAGPFAFIEASARLHLPKRHTVRFPRLVADSETATA